MPLNTTRETNIRANGTLRGRCEDAKAMVASVCAHFFFFWKQKRAVLLSACVIVLLLCDCVAVV